MQAVFNIDNYKECFMSTKPAVCRMISEGIEWFLKVLKAAITEIKYILKYIKIENRCFKM